MRGTPWRLLAAGALTAVLLDLPFPLAGPLPAWRTIFAWFALVPLLVSLLRWPETASGKSLSWLFRWAFLSGWFCGALWFGLNCYWVYDTMHLYGGMNAAMAGLSLVLFSLFLGVWFGGFALAVVLVRRATLDGRWNWVGFAAIPVLWTAMELAIARVPSFPWDELGYSQIDNGLLMRMAPWTGVMGVSFLLATGNALFAAGIVSWRAVWDLSFPPAIRATLSGKSLAGYGLVLALLGCAGFKDKPSQAPTAALAMLVQPNLDVNDDVWVGPEWDRHIGQFRSLATSVCKGYIAGIPETGAAGNEIKCGIAGPNPALIVWPESAAPFRGADTRFQEAMSSIAKYAPVIAGNIGMDEDPQTHQYRIYNSAAIIGQDGQLLGRYDKIHLVPFGEYVPARSAFFFVHQLTQQLTDLSRGTERKTFRIETPSGAHWYGVFICYESVFGDEVRDFVRNGAEVLVNISDDGWYGDTSAPWQHLNMARMRAIENRRWILRDTNSGVTAAIDPYGMVRQSIPRHGVDVLPAKFGYETAMTFYTRHGDWLAELCGILTLLLLGWSVRVLAGNRDGRG